MASTQPPRRIRAGARRDCPNAQLSSLATTLAMLVTRFNLHAATRAWRFLSEGDRQLGVKVAASLDSLTGILRVLELSAFGT